jgi:hypothetical protein
MFDAWPVAIGPMIETTAYPESVFKLGEFPLVSRFEKVVRSRSDNNAHESA